MHHQALIQQLRSQYRSTGIDVAIDKVRVQVAQSILERKAPPVLKQRFGSNSAAISHVRNRGGFQELELRDESVGSTRLPQPRRFYLSLFRVLSLSLSVSGLVDPASLASRRRDLRLATYLGRLHGVQPCLIRKGFNKRQTRGSDEAAIVVDTTVQWRDALYDDSNDLVAYQVATKYTLFPVEVVRLRAVISDYALDTPRQMYSPDHTFSYSAAASGASSTMKLSSQRLPNLESLAYTATQRTEESTPYTTEMTPQSNARQMKLSASRRERCRINQARYRKRQRQHEEEIEKHISDLQEEIQELETQHQDMMRSAPQNKSMWVVGTEYFRLFRHGYMAPMVAPEPTLAEKPCIRPDKQAHVQLDYLQTSMTPDVTDGNVSGAEALLENWKFLSLNHDDVHVQLKRLEQVAHDSLLAVTTTSVTITENTLRQVYPHLIEEHSTLNAKLLNQRLVMRGSVRFDWDASCGRMVRVESQIDMLTPMLKLLGSLDDVAYVFDKALLTPDGKITAN
ncbi:hypothetical protein PC117_g18844 [Phytophthora cactorum]|uniref:BZIP domain-containing protein n=3 Tax=Phytophthora cactorum TaxID=29920 RepID=A0A8T1C1B4_9STRA|nr:hypothetical protein PC117_g18844 [Phytophthora cactorum]